MNHLKKSLKSSMKIRFPDCDPFNHLNNSKYLDYIMIARGDQLIDNYNFDIYKIAREQYIGWVTAQTQISYFNPARLMEEVIIQTQLLSYSDKSLQMEGIMWNGNKTMIKALMWTKLVHYDLKTQKSKPHDERLLQFFADIVAPLSDTVSFDERAKSLRMQNEKA